jgi:hypothetical protein
MTAPLPNFLIIGAMKGGTTSLAAWLRSHPDVFIPWQKEIHFFDNPHRYGAGVDWYREQFAPGAGKHAIGEATPGYMAHPDVPERMARLLPDVKMIALLRNPTDRIYSQFLHLRAIGREKRPLRQVVDEELAGTAPPFGFYLARGRYLDQIRRLHGLFPPAALKVMLFDDLASDAAGLYAETCRFLGVDDAYRPDNLGKAYNPRMRVRSPWLWERVRKARIMRRIPASLAFRIDAVNVRPDRSTYEPMDPELRRRLVEAYVDQIPELEQLLGRDLSSWRA